MEYSLPAWLGALAGTVCAVALYIPSIRKVERHLRDKMDQSQLATLEEKLAIARRIILFIDIAICATVGYWLGGKISAPL